MYDANDFEVGFATDAVTVMIGDDPYTLGLFDTAGKLSLVFSWQISHQHLGVTDTTCIQQVRKIMTDYVPFHTLRPTSSWSVSPSHPLHHSRTSRKNGFLRCITTVPEFLALSSEHKLILEMIKL